MTVRAARYVPPWVGKSAKCLNRRYTVLVGSTVVLRNNLYRRCRHQCDRKSWWHFEHWNCVNLNESPWLCV